ncbi:glycerate kinase [Georgenia sp. TF02-10]|uniref:glycerate kinase n=1 Tax=Georgenia sp. TF02-10 TaxID=2917725 RepID=UPI001FA6C2A5|nr:glycerate kinase [Georgenia sp. TF02-10]UNX54887.1 glycerate kinase [Georgenia sp. TF02-10]
MKVLLAPDKFKGSAAAAEVAAHLAAGLRRAAPGLVVDELPVADGGEGTVDAALAAGFTAVETTATGPLGQPVTTRYARRGSTAVVEMAAVTGLQMVRPDPGTARRATSRGLGEVIAHALDGGARTVVVGVGGSASTDGGAGMLAALGARLTGPAGALADGGGALRDLAAVDLTGLHPRLAGAELVLASDVDNPLLGPRGAAAVYAPQKGADPAAVADLEAGLATWVAALEQAAAGDAGPVARHAAGLAGPVERAAGSAGPGADVGGPAGRAGSADPADQAGRVARLAATPTAGAAGGVGFALLLLGAERRAGIEVVLELAGLPARLAGADLVVTGEGSLDQQSLHGKAPVGVARAAAAQGVRAVAVCGRTTLTAAEAEQAGLAAVYALTDLEPDVARCIAGAGPLLERVGERIAAEQLPATGLAPAAAPGAGPAAVEQLRPAAPATDPDGAQR